jgi:hypothetical protein
VSIIDQWARALDGGESVWAVFVDFTKAFDRVDHTLFLNKMLTLGGPFFSSNGCILFSRVATINSKSMAIFQNV